MKADEHLRKGLAEVRDKLKGKHPDLYVHTRPTNDRGDLEVLITSGPRGQALAILRGQPWDEKEPVKITYHDQA